MMAAALDDGAALAPIRLRDMGAFHVGGRDLALSGLPRRELVMAEGGRPAAGRRWRSGMAAA